MRKLIFALIFTLIPTVVLAADRSQSYVTFDDGASTILQAFDHREIAVRLNLPVYPGDELRTSRRGRTEVRLSDGNVVALDRNTSLRFESILDSIEGESDQTVLLLEQGQVIVHRFDRSGSPLRLDTQSASYISSSGAIYSVEADGRGSDLLSVFDGSVEVRTPSDTTRVRAGEQTKVDARGVYASNDLVRGGTSDFERWYLKRAERYGRSSSRYLDRRLSYADNELSDHGSWLYVSEWGWTWRPRVSVSWRPYYYGNWSHTPSGRLLWVSDEPWGWVPYHYGRWAYSPSYGWVWIPGSGYSHAWVYWMYGPSYVGWIPAGWYDCYRPYYSRLYTPYARASFDAGFGFYGRVRIHDIDLRNWTFVGSNQIISTRVDRAAVTADVVRARLTRDNPAITVSNIQARFGRNDLSNPGSVIEAVARRGLGGGTGIEGVGSQPDATAFVRRDPTLSTSILDRIARPSRVAAGGGDASAPRAGAISIDRSRPSRLSGETGTAAGVDRGRTTPAIVRPPTATPTRVDRGRESGTQAPAAGIDRGRPARSRDDSPAAEWRERTIVRRGQPSSSPDAQAPSREPVTPNGSWRSDAAAARGRGVARPRTIDAAPAPDRSGSAEETPAIRRDRVARPEREDGASWRSRTSQKRDDTPRRVIDQIGGARVTPRRTEGQAAAPRARTSRAPESSGRRQSAAPRSTSAPTVERSAPAPRVERSAPPARQSAPRSRDSESGSNIKPD